MLNWILDKLLKRAETLSARQRSLRSKEPERHLSETDRLMRTAYSAHTAGNLDAAEAGYRKILFFEPENAEALYLLGEIQETKKNLDSAIEMMRRAISIAPGIAAFHAGLASALRQYGDISAAETAYREAIQLEPSNAEYHNDLGTLLQGQKRFPQAIECYQKALEISPGQAQALYNTATIYRTDGKTDEAIRLMEQALTQSPTHARGFIELAEQYNSANNPLKAIKAYEQAFSIEPNADFPLEILAQSRSNFGDLLQSQKRYREAIDQYRNALALQPDAFAIWVNLGNTQKSNHQHQESIDSYLKAIELNQNCSEAFSNIGAALKEHGNCSQAIDTYRAVIKYTPAVSWPKVDESVRFCELLVALALTDHAISLTPDSPGFLLNKGVLLEEIGQFEAALDCFDKAISLDPASPQANFNQGISLLRLGRLVEGWPQYDYRLQFGKDINEARLKEAPLWQGQVLSDEVLLIHAEQGLGDTIQFIRYFKYVTQRCKNVIFECQPVAKSLIETMAGMKNVHSSGQPLPKFDYQIPLLSLPGVFGTSLANIPADVPYICADSARIEMWKSQVGAYRELKVGLVWAGGAAHLGNRFRSCTLAVFAPLTSCQNVRFFSLQKGEPEKEAAAPPPGFSLVNCSPQIRDFRDTAALITNLDLVITVDTSVAHLAGAMGKPTWVLIPFCPDWRWMLEREDSPWYPTMRLFRQTSCGDWSAPMDRMREALDRLAQAKKLDSPAN